MKQMQGKDLINYIIKNNLQDAIVSVTNTIYFDGDHECNTTTDISLMAGSLYDYDQKKYIPTIEIYVDNNL